MGLYSWRQKVYYENKFVNYTMIPTGIVKNLCNSYLYNKTPCIQHPEKRPFPLYLVSRPSKKDFVETLVKGEREV